MIEIGNRYETTLCKIGFVKTDFTGDSLLFSFSYILNFRSQEKSHYRAALAHPAVPAKFFAVLGSFCFRALDKVSNPTATSNTAPLIII